MKQLRKILAFTLAETLIVIGIIGVVSALTLPNLNSSTGDKEKVVKVKKIYQNLNDALGRATAVYGPVNEWTINDANATAQTTRIGERLTEFMKVSKNCGMLTTPTCFSKDTIKTITGLPRNDVDVNSGNCYKFILADGTAVSFKYNSNMYIAIDIDGANKGKNTAGIDIFMFVLNATTGSFQDGTFYDVYSLLGTGIGLDAANWVLNYDNMEYLKTDSSGKCKNNTSRTLDPSANPPVLTCK